MQSLNVLSLEGIQGVRIERLARDMKVSKGSFYWHFENREDLFRSMIEYWKTEFTDVVINNPDHQIADGSRAVLNAMTMVRKLRLDRYELAVRNWADHDQTVAAMVHDVYTARERFFKGLFSKMGFSGRDAEVRVRLLLCFLSWGPQMMLNDKAESLARLKQYHEFLTRA